MREKRVSRVVDILERQGLQACLIKGMENIFYLTGFRGSEGTVLVTRGDVVLLTDSRYITYAREVAKGCIVLEVKGKGPIIEELFRRYGITRTGFDSDHTTFRTYQTWREASPAVEFVPLSNDIESIRRCKEPEEIEAMRKAISIATEAFTAVCEKIKPGKTEKEIANELDYEMRRLGAEEPSFETIVASGPRAALPHGHPTDKTVESGEVVVIDFGCRLDGYCSDETCTLSLGQTTREMKDVHGVVRDAQQKGIEAVRAGMAVQELDMIVRGLIEERGYGEFFGHGTGHGVGIAVHEPPAVAPKGEGILEEYMVITIEPGIYIPHVGGVRLEDMVLVRENGCDVLTRLRKDLFEI
ncbi:MAG: aminopeptidase P family protein [Syntrophorhabdales bacterium]